MGGVSTPLNCAAIQSKQWAKQGETSLRVLNNTGESLTRANISTPTAAVSFAAWRYQEKTLTVTDIADRALKIYLQGSGYDSSNAADNKKGGSLLRVDKAMVSSTVLRLSGPEELGESVWYDLVVATDTPNYDGPPFSGDGGKAK